MQKIAKVKAEIDARAKQRYDDEKTEYDAKMAERAEKEAQRSKKLGGKKPQEPINEPRAKDQINFTDEDSRIMPQSGGGFIQAYNAQAGVSSESILIVTQQVIQKNNDKQEVEPMLAELNKLPKELGNVEKAALDTGYFSEENVKFLEDQGIEPFIATGRQSHNQALEERLSNLRLKLLKTQPL